MHDASKRLKAHFEGKQHYWSRNLMIVWKKNTLINTEN